MRRFNLMAMMLLTVLMFSTLVKAQDATGNLSKDAIKSLVKGIKSDNEGLNRSCINFAGKYRVEEAVDALVSKMSAEKNPNLRVLIALSLYEIRDAKGLEAVREQSLSDEDATVRKISAMIFTEYVKNSNEDFASIKSKF